MKTFKVNFKINDKDLIITPYNTAMEKDLLIMATFEIDNLDVALEILEFDKHNDVKINELSVQEKMAILYKYRELSIGDLVDINFKCSECKHPNDSQISISSIVNEPKYNDKNIKKLSTEVNDDNIQEFIVDDTDVLELELQQYDELMQRVKDNQYTFNFKTSCSCIKCKHKNIFSLEDNKTVLEYLSEETIMTIYKSYNNMIFFGHYSKKDIDSMYPFERSIFLGLINKTREELAK